MKDVLVSIIMSVYNGEKFLSEAIESILNQTYRNIEFIIINDGSTDESKSIIEKYLYDSRIKYLDNLTNKGLIYSLNLGIDKSKGKYIARMDCDDISYLHRIETQVKFMEENEDVVLSGSGVDIIFEGIPFYKKRINPIVDYEELKVKCLFNSCFTHPSVIIRREYLIKNKLRYEEKYKNAEDYALWTNILPYAKCVNIKEALLKYRVVKQSVTRTANRDMNSRREVFKNIYLNYFKNLDIGINEEELDIHFECCMVQNLDKVNYDMEFKQKYLLKFNYMCNDIGLKKEYIERSFKNIIIKNCIYQKYDIKNINKILLIDDKGAKKLYINESLKKIIKKFYK